MGLDQSLMRVEKGADPKEHSSEIIYWRKVNCVHKYFTDPWFDDGNEDDNCVFIPVSIGQIKDLKRKCQEILKKENFDKAFAHKTLPTESGFFFGSTEYDEDYIQDLKDTIENIKANEPFDDENFDYYYFAWY